MEKVFIIIIYSVYDNINGGNLVILLDVEEISKMALITEDLKLIENIIKWLIVKQEILIAINVLLNNYLDFNNAKTSSF